MKLKHLEYFTAVVDNGSFTLAADALNISQPTLSQQIRTMEDYLGAPLFDRLRSGPRLTDAGTGLLRHARQVLQSVAEARQELDEHSGRVTGQLRIGTVPSMNDKLLPRSVAIFRDKFPNMKLQIVERSSFMIEDRLAAGELDLGLGLPSFRLEEIEVNPLIKERIVLAFQPGHPLDGRSRIQIGDLGKAPMALFIHATPLRDALERFFHANAFKANVVYETNSVDALVRVVSCTDMCALVPESSVRDKAGVSYVTLMKSDLHREISVLRNRDMHLSRASELLVEILTEQVAVLKKQGDLV